MHKSFWITRDAGCLNDGDVGFDNSSRMEAKRSHQWFMDSPGPELFSNKKQAVEHSSNNRPVAGMSHMNISPWNNTSSFQSVSGHFSDRLFGSEPLRPNNGSNFLSSGNGNMNMGRKDFIYGSNCSMGLSMSHNIEDPSASISFGGIRKVKVNQVRDSSNDISSSVGHSYARGDDNIISMGPAYNKRESNTISLGSAYNNGDENTISISPTFSKADGNFISIRHAFSKDDGNFISMGHNYNKEDGSILSVGQPFDKEDANFITIGPSYDKEDNHFISMAPSYNKGHDNFISMGPSDKTSENFILMGSSFSKGRDNIISNGPTYDKADSDISSMAPAQDKGNSGILSMGHNYNKGDNNAISFGGFDDEPETSSSGNIITGYELLVSNQDTAQTSEVSAQNVLPQANADPQLNTDSAPKIIADPQLNSALEANSKTDTDIKGKEPKASINAAPKNKEPKTPIGSTSKNKELKTSKKVPANNFPSNVKSLLSTGLLDGVPVKYVSWSREKTLQGIIKGTGYLCGCKECGSNKALNAYEFERHANCKTKHPNNHIFFENGKTIYAVVQELKNTSQEVLFNAIQTVTGSDINQKNFCIWKASYQAATRELQRIYGKDEVTVPS